MMSPDTRVIDEMNVFRFIVTNDCPGYVHGEAQVGAIHLSRSATYDQS